MEENISEGRGHVSVYLTGHGIDGDRTDKGRGIYQYEKRSFGIQLQNRSGTSDCSVGVVTNNISCTGEGAAIARKMSEFRESGHGTFQVSKLAVLLSYIPREILAIIQDKLMGNL